MYFPKAHVCYSLNNDGTCCANSAGKGGRWDTHTHTNKAVGVGGGRGAASTLTNKMHTIHIMHTTYKTNAHATTRITVKVAFATDSSYT